MECSLARRQVQLSSVTISVKSFHDDWNDITLVGFLYNIFVMKYHRIGNIQT
jgi:hypothetical protein